MHGEFEAEDEQARADGLTHLGAGVTPDAYDPPAPRIIAQAEELRRRVP